MSATLKDVLQTKTKDELIDMYISLVEKPDDIYYELEGDFKNKDTLREIIHELSDITGKEVSEEKENKIIDMIVNDKVPKDLEKYV